MKYNLILTDNPWRYDNQQQNDPARGGITYPTLTMEDLYNLPVSNIAADNSILVSWATFPKLFDEYYEKYNPLSIIRQWGFRPVTTLFVWVKLNRKGWLEHTITNEDILVGGVYSGLGRYTNSNAEIAIVARRGKGIPRIAKNVKQLIFAPIGSHSAKPQEQYNRLWQLYGDVPRIELFARKENPPPDGWKATGYDFDGVDIRDYLKGYGDGK